MTIKHDPAPLSSWTLRGLANPPVKEAVNMRLGA
jgi:hypothetical protein